MLPYAIAYARRGWPVFPLHTPTTNGGCSCGKPCGNPGKHPRTKRGFKDATTDEETIRNWWKQWPDANIGIAMGELSKLLAVDVDPKNGGAGTWQRLVMDHDLPTLTVTVDTGSGGWHYYYLRPTDRGVCRSRANAVKPGIDTRCDGGYVVAPPSLHVSGKRYAFRPECDPGQTDVQPCPDWMLDLLYPQPTVAAVSKPKPQAPASAGDGWLLAAFKAAGWVRRELGPDRSAVVCPWEAEHSHAAGDQDSSTVVFRPTAGKTLGWFHCSHAHCSSRGLADVRAALPPTAVAAADAAYPRHDADGVVADDPAPNADWQAELQRKPSGELLPLISNAVSILTHDDQWRGVLAHDAFASRSVFLKPPPWYAEDAPAADMEHTTIDDDDDARLVAWLERRYALRVARDTAHTAIELVCQRNAFHPVREYLTKCRDKWDGKIRLPTLAQVYLSAPTEAHYLTAPLRWFICAVRRIFEPGCQADSILVLEGLQGIGKSKALRILFSDPWFADDIGDPSSKDAAEGLRGKWCIEIGELRWRKSDEDTRKAFISRRVDHYRPAYGRRAVDIPRQNVLAATTNEHDWQTDVTGARRYWAVRCVAIRHEWLARDRDQLWGEAMVRFEAGEQSWLLDEEVPAQVDALAERREVDPWETRIMAWVDQRSKATVPEILTVCLEIEPARQGQGEARRVARVLRANGWEQTKRLGSRGSRVLIWECSQ